VVVRAGDQVAQGDLVGLALPSLHLGVREGDRYVDPALLLTAARRHARLVPVGRFSAADPVA
jgi:murein DD-endopeptidase MepM/ murein hydrolase activator NlpD